jgi:hypothetical protein
VKGAVVTLWGTRLLTDEPGDPGSGATINILQTREQAVAHMLKHDPAFDPASLPPEITHAEMEEQMREAEIQHELEQHAKWKERWPEWYAAHYDADGNPLPVQTISDAPRAPLDPAEIKRAAQELRSNYAKPFTPTGKPRDLVPE